MKEIVSSIIVVVIVCAASFLLEKYLDKTSSEIIENLENLIIEKIVNSVE